jgi:hypothetical protein
MQFQRSLDRRRIKHINYQGLCSRSDGVLFTPTVNKLDFLKAFLFFFSIEYVLALIYPKDFISIGIWLFTMYEDPSPPVALSAVGSAIFS